MKRPLAVLVLTLSLGWALEDAALGAARKVAVGGRSLALVCQGEGRPAVVLEAGLGDGAAVWAAVMPGLVPLTRVCAYDRADLGDSDPSPPGKDRTIADVQRDLTTLLAAAGLDEPVVLVGHSAGGLIALMLARDQPGRVAGLVLVDSSHPDQTRRLAEVRPRRASLAWETFLAHRPSLERWDVAAAFSQGPAYARAGSLGDLPLIVLSRQAAPSPEMLAFSREVIWPGYSLAILQREEAVWLELQRELAATSTRGDVRVLETSDHYLQLAAPEEVVAAIREVVAAVRRASKIRRGR